MELTLEVRTDPPAADEWEGYRPAVIWWEAWGMTSGLETTTSLTQTARLWQAWALVPDLPPDPMTVAAWHPMETLPDEHEERVLVRHASGHVVSVIDSRRSYDAGQNRVAWCPLAPLLALIEAGTVEP